MWRCRLLPKQSQDPNHRRRRREQSTTNSTRTEKDTIGTTNSTTAPGCWHFTHLSSRVGRAQHPQRFHERQHHVGCREELGGIAWYIGTRRRWPVVILIAGTAVQLLRPPLVKYLSKQSTRRNVTRPHELVHTIGLSSR